MEERWTLPKQGIPVLNNNTPLSCKYEDIFGAYTYCSLYIDLSWKYIFYLVFDLSRYENVFTKITLSLTLEFLTKSIPDQMN